MNRSLSVDRLYSLGDYKNIRVTDTINDLPEELMTNEEFVDAVRLLQLASVDLVHQKYYRMYKDLGQYPDGSEERYNSILSVRANAMEEIQKLLTNKE